MPSIRLIAFDPDRDLPTLSAWLRRPHVTRWWGDPNAALDAVRKHSRETEAMIQADSRIVGYLCWQKPTREELRVAGLDDLPADLMDIDILIGEVNALGRGIGPEALRRLLAKLAATGVVLAGMATHVTNTRALAAYPKAGFRPYRDFVEARQRMRYFVNDIRPKRLDSSAARQARELQTRPAALRQRSARGGHPRASGKGDASL